MAEIPSAEQSVNLMVSNMHNIAQSHQSASVSIGRVMAPPPEIKIAWNNIILEKEQIYIDQFLLPKYQRMLKGDIEMPHAKGKIKTETQSRRGGSGKPSYTSHNHKINDDYKADIKSDYKSSAIYTDVGLQTGDYVSILPLEGGQKFIVLGKLVYLPEFKLEEDEDD